MSFDSEWMGHGTGYDNDRSFYDHSVDMSNLLNTRPLKDVMLETEEVSYVKHNPTLNDAQPMDNAEAVQQYFLNKLTAGLPKGIDKKSVSEKFSDVAVASSQFANEHIVSILLTFIFMLIIAIVVLEIMHTRKIYKLVKAMMKNVNAIKP